MGANEADASLAVRAFDSIVVTAEGRSKRGPLRLAAEQGGRVVFLEEVEKSGLSIKEFIQSIETGVANIPSASTPTVRS